MELESHSFFVTRSRFFFWRFFIFYVEMSNPFCDLGCLVSAFLTDHIKYDKIIMDNFTFNRSSWDCSPATASNSYCTYERKHIFTPLSGASFSCTLSWKTGLLLCFSLSSSTVKDRCFCQKTFSCSFLFSSIAQKTICNLCQHIRFLCIPLLGNQSFLQSFKAVLSNRNFTILWGCNTV